MFLIEAAVLLLLWKAFSELSGLQSMTLPADSSALPIASARHIVGELYYVNDLLWLLQFGHLA